MKSCLLCLGTLLLLNSQLVAAVPFTDDFGASGPVAGWTQVAGTGTLTTVADGTNSVPASSGSSDGFRGSVNAGGSDSVQTYLAGGSTDTNYTVSAYLRMRYSSIAAYGQALMFYQNGGTGGSVSIGGTSSSSAAITLNINSSAYTKSWTTPGDIPSMPIAWYHLKVELQGTTAKVYLNGTQLPGIADWTATVPAVSQGQFGYGQSGLLGSAPIDEFRVTATTAPSAVGCWMLYE